MPIGQRRRTSAVEHREAEAPIAAYVALMCIGSGSLDAISFLALGDAFASVMTGNIVFLGMSAVHGSGVLALHCGTALIGYSIGGACTSRLAHRLRRENEARVWPARVTILLGLELVLLLAVASAWWWYDGAPDQTGKLVLLAVAAFSMGVQGAAIRVLGVSVSTTYMTGALTTLLEAVATRRRFTHTERSAAAGLLSLAVGAALGAAVLEYERPAALFVPCVGLTLVVVTSALQHRKASMRRR